MQLRHRGVRLLLNRLRLLLAQARLERLFVFELGRFLIDLGQLGTHLGRELERLILLTACPRRRGHSLTEKARALR